MIMSINKIIIFSIAVSFVVFINVQTGSADDFDRKQFEGDWFLIARILPRYNASRTVNCYHVKITKDENSAQDFKITVTLRYNRQARVDVGQGKITDSKIIARFPLLSSKAVYTVQRYNNDQELILSGHKTSPLHALLSRTTWASPQTLSIFDQLAMDSKKLPLYFPPDGCTITEVPRLG